MPDPAEAVSILSRTPGVLRALLEGLPEPWLEADEGEGTFSPRDVLGHLIHGEKTDWVPRIKRILEAVYELQLDGKVTDLDEAVSAARNLL